MKVLKKKKIKIVLNLITFLIPFTYYYLLILTNTQ